MRRNIAIASMFAVSMLLSPASAQQAPLSKYVCDAGGDKVSSYNGTGGVGTPCAVEVNGNPEYKGKVKTRESVVKQLDKAAVPAKKG